MHNLGACVPQIRPHFYRRGRELFFLISRKPLLEIAADEVSLYESIDGRKTVSELEKMHPRAGSILLRWWRLPILELLPPVVSPPRPHLVVVEPHMDDAILAAGGGLIHRRGRYRITILSVVKWSNFTSYMVSGQNFSDVGEVTDIRLRESDLVARVLGADHRCLDWSDAPLRLCPSERWDAATAQRFKKASRAFTVLFPNRKDVSALAEQLRRELDVLSPDEVSIPMGVSSTVDHLTTRSACLLALAGTRNRLCDVPTVMYEDVPSADVLGHASQIRSAFASVGTRLVRTTEEISDVFEEKLRLVSIYGSQFKLSFIEPTLRGLAEREGASDGTLAEVYHRLEGRICLPAESRLSRDWAGLARLEEGTRALLRRRTEHRHLTVIALPSSHLGVWRINTKSLSAAFPNAFIHFVVSCDSTGRSTRPPATGESG